MLNGNMDSVTSPIRKITASAQIYSNTTDIAYLASSTDDIKEIKLERTGRGKFFGYGVSQKVTLKLRDKERNYFLYKGDEINSLQFDGDNWDFPYYYITEVKRDENTNDLIVTAHDLFNDMNKATVSELELDAPYTINDFVLAVCNYYSNKDMWAEIPELSVFNTFYEQGANFDGTETLREALDAVAEATQTIYYLGLDNRLTFKRLKMGMPDLEIDATQYFTLDIKTAKSLRGICHITELEDNIIAQKLYGDVVQNVRSNPFWELRDDAAELIQSAVDEVGGLYINQFNCVWRGNYLLDIGDLISFTGKDGTGYISYFINDTLLYNGGLKQTTSFTFEEDEKVEAATPTNLGEAIKQTYARIDKANKEITLLAGETKDTKNEIAALYLTTDSISATVEGVQKFVTDGFEATEENITALSNKVSAVMTNEQIQLSIEQGLAQGTNKVTTATGFTFNEDGLTIAKTNSNITTTITEDGMVVTKGNNQVLTANNEGVQAIDLHAKTYLIVGNNSRFEDKGNSRTACYWIGG